MAVKLNNHTWFPPKVAPAHRGLGTKHWFLFCFPPIKRIAFCNLIKGVQVRINCLAFKLIARSYIVPVLSLSCPFS